MPFAKRHSRRSDITGLSSSDVVGGPNDLRLGEAHLPRDTKANDALQVDAFCQKAFTAF